jgi:hypothetical protein
MGFAGGVQTRGIMKWAPLYGAPITCTSSPSTCYTGGGGISEQLNTGWLNKLCSDRIGHIRIGIDPGPLMADPSHAAQYYSDIFAALDQIGTSCLKIVLNIAPSFTPNGYDPAAIQSGGHTSALFQSYLAMLQGLLSQIASHSATHPDVYGPQRFAVDLFNEPPGPASVLGGLDEQYAMMVLEWQTARAAVRSRERCGHHGARL